MRISERQRYKTTTNRVDRARQSNVDSLEKISTLKRINKLSDDPIGAGRVIRGRDRLEGIEQFRRNVDFSRGFLDKTENAVQSIGENLMRAKELAVGLANSTYDDKSREATSREVRQIMSEVVKLANTSYANRFVFSGFRTATPAMSDEGKYLGDDGTILVQVDDGDFRQMNIQSRYLFEADTNEKEKGHFNMVDSLQMLFEGLTGNDVDEIRRALDELDHQLQKTTSYQANIGALAKALESGGKKLEGESIQIQTQLSQIEDVDMFTASSDFHRSESILQSTLLASNKMLQPSLLNFMQ
jgi:flagellar hook-associated protein 3 FlgL